MVITSGRFFQRFDLGVSVESVPLWIEVVWATFMLFVMRPLIRLRSYGVVGVYECHVSIVWVYDVKAPPASSVPLCLIEFSVCIRAEAGLNVAHRASDAGVSHRLCAFP